MKYILIFLSLILAACSSVPGQHRPSIDLSGMWQFAIDTSAAGIPQKWYNDDLQDSIALPGTMDLNHKGFLNKDTTTMHLNRLYTYEGMAWYRKKVTIPESFKDKYIELILERTKPTDIWIDSLYIGSSRLLQSPQHFDVSAFLSPGEHHLTVRVNNDLKLTPYGNVHIYSDDTQTNWNGILGRIVLEAAPETHITNLQVYPDIGQKKIDIKLDIYNGLNIDTMAVELWVEKTVKGKTTTLKPQKFIRAYQAELKFEYILGDESTLWDEYQQPLYTLIAVISTDHFKDVKSVPFGMRRFATAGTQFTINGRTTFLRGKQEAAVFPLTGFPPMDVNGWVRVFRIAKSYGINHYRFHSYCPPEAAFTAADQEGIYLQAELPFWSGLESDSVAQMLLQEGKGMLEAYANHPSFVMFSHGNEIWSGHDRVEKNIIALKEYDNRPLYTMGSNNNIGYVPPRSCSDFFVAARTPFAFDTIMTHTRLTHAFADSRDGGILNTQTPSTEVNFSYAVNHINIPLISHEMGQYQIYPDYREISKYTGVLRAWNLQVFQESLKKKGMGDMDSIFHKASGAWSAICYKAEMEAALRTPGMAGFQLLDLQDFPGQGTALVGILDAFMDSKNVITPQKWKQSCNDVVLLLEFPKYCWTNNESFHSKVEVANYSAVAINNDVIWELKDINGKLIKAGKFPNAEMHNGGISAIGEININLADIKNAQKLTIDIFIKNSTYSNSYPIWIYPSTESVSQPGDIKVTQKLTPQIIKQLQNGAKVLFFPQTKDIQGKSFPGLFPPDFWNWGMFKGISERAGKPVSPGTLGLLMNPDHKLFNMFPTDFHSNWQWFSIIKAGNALILDITSAEYRPIVQVIDNLQRNHKLGLIFEFKVDRGSLLVCMSQLPQIMDKPEARQLYQSIINYMSSNNFNPEYEIHTDQLME